MILASVMSYGTAPSCQHWQMTSYNGNNKMVLQCFIMSGGIPSLPGALPEVKLSMALLRSSIVGSASSSVVVDRQSTASRGEGDTMFCIE